MGKGYRGKTCAYCAEPFASTTADHVFGRGFFPPSERANLPKVPACANCNHEKSELEHYLMTVLPFGGRHAAANEMLTVYVPDRLTHNRALHENLAAGRTVGRIDADGLLVAEMGIPLDSEKLDQLFEFIAKGLAFYHWGEPIPPDCNVRGGMIHPEVEHALEALLALSGQRVKANVGNGAFDYEAVRSVQDPHITIWRFGVYGEMKVTDPKIPHALPCRMWVTSSQSPSIIAMLNDWRKES